MNNKKEIVTIGWWDDVDDEAVAWGREGVEINVIIIILIQSYI